MGKHNKEKKFKMRNTLVFNNWDDNNAWERDVHDTNDADGGHNYCDAAHIIEETPRIVDDGWEITMRFCTYCMSKKKALRRFEKAFTSYNGNIKGLIKRMKQSKTASDGIHTKEGSAEWSLVSDGLDSDDNYWDMYLCIRGKYAGPNRSPKALRWEHNIETPLGDLVVYPSGDSDYPGVYIDLKRDGSCLAAPLALVEYTATEHPKEKCDDAEGHLICRTWDDVRLEDWSSKTVFCGIDDYFERN